MTNREKGFLLLTSHLGNPQRRPLSIQQFRNLSIRVRQSALPKGENLEIQHLLSMGYNRADAKRILSLLDEEELLERYLIAGKKCGCIPITRVSEAYPQLLRSRLGLAAPGCLWAKGDVQILSMLGVSLVGSRDIREDNRKFSEEVGFQAARQGYCLVSGNARGADQAAQMACLSNQGQVITVVADCLAEKPAVENMLYLSEDCFDAQFSTVRALSRNSVIHGLGWYTFVAQCELGKGGSWSGSVKNLKNGWSPLFVFDDGSEAYTQLIQLGANSVNLEQLQDFSQLNDTQISFL